MSAETNETMASVFRRQKQSRLTPRAPCHRKTQKRRQENKSTLQTLGEGFYLLLMGTERPSDKKKKIVGRNLLKINFPKNR